MMPPTHLNEPSRAIPIQDRYDVVVCGGGPAGIAAAISAGRAGARTCIIELQCCLGGIWTAGVLCYILDSINKAGLIVEIRERLRARGAIGETLDLYDAEAMKLLLDEMCAEAGVDIRL
ncbi:MAG: FAD-dependent oxidoreductase, partial [Rariglobus sp.]